MWAYPKIIAHFEISQLTSVRISALQVYMDVTQSMPAMAGYSTKVFFKHSPHPLSSWGLRNPPPPLSGACQPVGQILAPPLAKRAQSLEYFKVPQGKIKSTQYEQEGNPRSYKSPLSHVLYIPWG
ncbi:hypothetical protein HOLleu_13197 [Holothuria leucospilota]|uniref:Uncharacterized protein n=1 Tax=Holothuria leucospilota TaxID=206669 RepID=A0A9Q1CBG6_HOLLE|nr:hypothetical protein HOLleu_13197 [Holothuria leucospilota]